MKNIKSIRSRFLQEYKNWIFLPEKVDYFISENGKDFTLLKSVEHGINVDNKKKLIHEFSCKTNNTKAKYSKVLAANIGKCPTGQPWCWWEIMAFYR